MIQLNGMGTEDKVSLFKSTFDFIGTENRIANYEVDSNNNLLMRVVCSDGVDCPTAVPYLATRAMPQYVALSGVGSINQQDITNSYSDINQVIKNTKFRVR